MFRQFSPQVMILLFAALLLVVVLMAITRVPVSYNIRNLMVRWKTTLMTALAFTLVVGLLTVMLAFVTGMRRLTEDSGSPENVIVLSDGATDEAFSNLAYSDTNDIDNLLDERHRKMLARDKATNQPLASRQKFVVVGQPLQGSEDEKNPRRQFLQLRGVEDALIAAQVHRLELFEGGQWFRGVRALPGSDRKGIAVQATQAVAFLSGKQFGVPVLSPAVSETAIEAVLGEGVARELAKPLGKDSLKPGDVFHLGPRKWIVVGVMKSAGLTFGSEIWADATLVGDLFGKKVYNSIFIRTRDARFAEPVAKFLSDPDKTGKAAFKAMPEPEYYSILGSTNKQFLYAIIVVAIIIGIGGVFGVMNTMFAAISQRIKDIGVLRLLGFPRWQILVSFFLESLIIALLGGLVGAALGSLVDGIMATSIVSSGQGGGKSIVLRLTVDANILAAAILYALGMGAIGGLIPSLSAMRLRPLESLR